MTAPDPPEAPEHHTGTLSPISPKPIHFPSPANIPILENQMDPSFSDPSYDASDPLPAPAASQPVHAPSPPPQDGLPNNLDDPAPLAGELSGQSSLDGAQQFVGDSELPDSTTNEDAPVSTTASVAPDISNLVPQATVDNGSFFPTLDPASALTSASIPSDLNIQELLKTISASSAPPANPSETSPVFSVDPATSQTLLPTQTAPAAPAPSAPDNDVDTAIPSFAQNPLSTQATPQTELGGLQTPVAASHGSLNSPAGLNTPSLDDVIASSTAPGVSAVSNVGSDNVTFQPPSTEAARPVSSTTENLAPPIGHHPNNIDAKDGENVPWDRETQRKYDQFLDEERQYVLDGNWDRFPVGSRLFIGNLSSEKVTKRDLFHVFHRYGKLAQISIKQAYGFVQFLEAHDCARALQHEQSVSIRGRKVHLEISKPQKSKNSNNGGNNEGRASRNRRSRSPDRNGRSTGDRHRGRNRGRQDNYRPQRSPSPRARDSYRSRRSPDRYDGRRRSRSPPPRDGIRGSSSNMLPEDGLPIPRRAPHQVPELQILLKDLSDRSRPFIDYVKGCFLQRGVKVDDLTLYRLDEPAVMRRQIIEGVLAVIRLDLEAQHRQKFHVTVFDRSAGFSNVRFEEYKDMDLNICVELVIRAKQNAPPRPPTDYAMSQYGIPSAANTPAGAFAMQQAQVGPNPAALGSMDSATLQRLLQGVQNPQATPSSLQLPGQMPGQPSSPLLALGNGQMRAPPGPQYGQQPSPHATPGAAGQFAKPPSTAYNQQFGVPNGGVGSGTTSTSSNGGFPRGQLGAGSPANGADIQNIIAQLGQYRQ